LNRSRELDKTAFTALFRDLFAEVVKRRSPTLTGEQGQELTPELTPYQTPEPTPRGHMPVPHPTLKPTPESTPELVSVEEGESSAGPTEGDLGAHVAAASGGETGKSSDADSPGATRPPVGAPRPEQRTPIQY